MNLRKIRNISLKWKLLIPFLFLPAALTVLLVVWGIRSQHSTLSQQEKRISFNNYKYLQQRINIALDSSAALAVMAASNPEVQKALSQKDRDALTRIFQSTYMELSRLADIKQFHFHIYPGESFLRLHRLKVFGDELLSYRQTIRQAYETGKVVSGLEVGVTGFGLRAVAPVYYENNLVGSVEFGSSIEQSFLESYKTDFMVDLTIYVSSPGLPNGLRVLASTEESRNVLNPAAVNKAVQDGQTVYFTHESGTHDLSVLVGPIRDFKGDVAAVVEITRDRSGVMEVFYKQSAWIVLFGLVLLILALIFVWWISTLFLAPIGALVDQAEKITAGKRVPQMEVTVQDEFGALAGALNRMLASLEASQYRLQNQAYELEARVRQRTLELVRSEEKFRTLVENIPLVVYRLENDLIRTFVSSHIERLTGWPAEEQVGGPAVWSSYIHPQDRQRVLDAKQKALEGGYSLEIEYSLQDRQGREVDILDHAEPVRGESGDVLYMEGYMLDIRERRRLEEHTFREEELKTLGEISSRLAHEFRNPLSIVGLSASRLSKALPDSHSAAPYAAILIEEISRLETILTMIQSYIKPIELRPQPMVIESFVNNIVELSTEILREKEIDFDLEIKDKLPRLNIDPEHVERALLNLIKNAAYQIPQRGTLSMSIALDGKMVEIKIAYPAGYLPDDQLRHFFYPFTTEEADTSLVELPLVPVIIHKHNGVITVEREGEDLVAVTINLPAAINSSVANGGETGGI